MNTMKLLYIFFISLFLVACKVTDVSESELLNDTGAVKGVDYLLNNGVSSDALDVIGNTMSKHLNNVAETNLLTKEQVNTLIDSYILKMGESEKQSKDDVPHIQNLLNSGTQTLSYAKTEKTAEVNLCENWDTYTIAGQNNGAGWVVRSKTGYNHATGFVTLPSNISITSNEVPYVMFGGSTTNTGMYTDAGVFYRLATNKWNIFYNFYLKVGATWKRYWNHVELPGNLTKIYLSYTVDNIQTPDQGNEERVTITVINSLTWQTLATLTARTAYNYVYDDFSNFGIYRATTLAQSNEDLTNGSYIENVKWNNVYLYSPVGYWPWNCTRTANAGKYYKDVHWDKIIVNSYSPWTDDDISIHY